MSQKSMQPPVAEQALITDQPKKSGKSVKSKTRSEPTPIRGRGEISAAPGDSEPDSAAPTALPETGSVGKIREILFGEQMQDYETRFVELEEHIQRESRRSQEELEKRFSRLDTFMRDEFEKIADRLQQESNDRVEAAHSTLNQLTEAETRVATLVTDLGAELHKEHDNIRTDMAERTKEQMQQLDDSRDELMSTLNDYEGRLRHEKLDRESLAEMLIGVADRLRTQDS